MSIWSILGNALTGGVGYAYGKNKSDNSADRAKKLMSEQTSAQMKLYKEQSEITKAEMDRVKGEQDVQKRRINEKQIRSLRGSYRKPGGFLGNGGGGASANTLGNSGDLTNKLGG